MDKIEHFSHSQHPLKLIPSSWNWSVRCKICLEELWYVPEIYSCVGCSYSLHIACAKLKERMSHPFHPDHTLMFRDSKEISGHYQMCCACKGSFKKYYAYFCEECSYALDLRCAALEPVETQEGKMPSTNHQHPLIECQKPLSSHFRYYCSICGEEFEGDDDHIYVCLECKSFLHEICVALPDKIENHPFHLEHPLQLLDRVPSTTYNCDACDRHFKNRVYYCSNCCFAIDVHCATLVPTARNHDPNKGDLIQPITHSHPHPLIQCDKKENFRRRCSGCDLPFEDFVYVCFECHVLLEKSCADLPCEIVHPFHQHGLILGKYTQPCKGCHTDSYLRLFHYSCQKCRFSLDLKCALKKFEFITSEIHEHALAWFDVEIRGERCKICRLPCGKFCFRCVDCDHSIHDHCYPSLPVTIKHQCHCDPLTLSRSKIKDILDEDVRQVEFYCHACEDLRTLAHPTYYCAECHFISHVHCVISEIIAYLQSKASYKSQVVEVNSRQSSSPLLFKDMIFLEEDEATKEGSSSAPIRKEGDKDLDVHELIEEEEDATKSGNSSVSIQKQGKDPGTDEATKNGESTASRQKKDGDQGTNKDYDIQGLIKEEDEATKSGTSTASIQKEANDQQTKKEPDVQGLTKEEDEARKSGNSRVSTGKEVQGQNKSKDPVLQELDERISVLRKEVDALTAEIVKLEEKRTQHIALSRGQK